MISSKKQTNHHFRYSILINNSQQKVWDYLTDVNRWKEWDTELIDSSLSEKFSLHAKGILTPKKGPKLKFHISELISNKSYTFVTKMPVGTLEIKRTLVNTGDQIEFTDDIRFTGFLKRIFGLILGSGFKTVLPEVMENFKRLAEQE
ncbi:SRPBCC family protein [uncultured Aquimarina sp.]|uniref:SRPBCC family protein n=1 Tax=uncultured Aquimarina sp. TaxID=575652 RepID=UPI002626D8DE|nr:SRPBCC family protein [uncultured Aquimarina sp.]